MSQHDDSENFDAMAVFNQLFDQGFHSRKLDAYLQMRELVVRRIGDSAAPIYNVHQIREGIELWFRKEVARGYRSNKKLAELAALYYNMPVNADTSLDELTKLVKTFPGNNFGIQDVDALADLFCTVVGRSINVVGQMLVYDTIEFGRDVGDVAAMVRSCGGKC